MDPVAMSTQAAIADFGMKADAVRTLKKYWIANLPEDRLPLLCTKVLANDAIEQVIIGPLTFDRLEVGSPYDFRLITVPIRSMDDESLQQFEPGRAIVPVAGRNANHPRLFQLARVAIRPT